MPDGDEVYESLGHDYQQVYMKICEGKSQDDDMILGLVKATVEHVKKYGDEPLQLLQEIIRICTDNGVVPPLFSNPVSDVELDQQIAHAAQEACMNKRAKHLILQASEQSLTQIRRGVIINNLHTEMLQGYFKRVYRADFEAYVEHARDHRYEALPKFVNDTLAHIREQVQGRFASFAEHLTLAGTVTVLR